MTTYKVIVETDDGRKGIVKVTNNRALAYHVRNVYARSYRTVVVEEKHYNENK